MKNQKPDFKKYQRKIDKSEEKAVSSVLLKVYQIDFLKQHNLNLSKLIRDYLDSLIDSSSGKK